MKSGIRIAALLLEGFLALTAIPAGMAMVFRPDGSLLGFPPGMLAGTPFHGYLVPGLVLSVVIGGAASAALAALLARRRTAPRLVAASGAVTTGWIAAQLWFIGYQGLLQPLILAIGACLLLTGPVSADLRGSGSRPGNR